MSFDSFKSSTVGPEALAARLELEKRNREQRERDRAIRLRDKERRDSALAVATEDSKNYEMSEGSGEEASPGFAIPKLSRGTTTMSAIDQKMLKAINQVSAQATVPATKAETGFKLKRF